VLVDEEQHLSIRHPFIHPRLAIIITNSAIPCTLFSHSATFFLLCSYVHVYGERVTEMARIGLGWKVFFSARNHGMERSTWGHFAFLDGHSMVVQRRAGDAREGTSLRGITSLGIQRVYNMRFFVM
jgi:hypothetical protein